MSTVFALVLCATNSFITCLTRWQSISMASRSNNSQKHTRPSTW